MAEDYSYDFEAWNGRQSEASRDGNNNPTSPPWNWDGHQEYVPPGDYESRRGWPGYARTPEPDPLNIVSHEHGDDVEQNSTYTEMSAAELEALCLGELKLGMPTPRELVANRDPLFGRVYKAGKYPDEDPAQKASAMAFLRAEIEKLKDTEIFRSSFASPSERDDTSLHPWRSKEPLRGGGGIQGPSVEDAVDVDKLLAEMRGLPPARS